MIHEVPTKDQYDVCVDCRLRTESFESVFTHLGELPLDNKPRFSLFLTDKKVLCAICTRHVFKQIEVV